MKDPNLPLEGGCRCGKVRFRVTAPPIITMLCHCKGCQRMSSSAFSTSAAFPADAFEVIQGETVLGGLKQELPHHFCPDCMSWMFTRPPQLDFMVNIRAPLFDDTDWYAPFAETFASTKLAWVDTSTPHSFPEFPGADDMGPLIEAYGAALGRSV
ncbi:GFA family protein [Henriciella litoralis]|uniref:GFA family protein n=1 Tax=Henriciella litoralis TaxID=568102 RepID=UPI0009FDB7B5|nr:GFA family protein [Henriciella litoralis]